MGPWGPTKAPSVFAGISGGLVPSIPHIGAGGGSSSSGSSSRPRQPRQQQQLDDDDDGDGDATDASRSSSSCQAAQAAEREVVGADDAARASAWLWPLMEEQVLQSLYESLPAEL